MFEYISGKLAGSTLDQAIIDVNGIGYQLEIPGSTAQQMPHNGETVKLFTHFHVREDSQKLYGFYTDNEREVFKHLISINKVGPKVALNILSGMSVADLVRSVQTQDSSRFKAVSGIGPKTAQRLVLELKGKLKIETVATPVSAGAQDVKGQVHISQARSDAFDGMLALGYNEMQVVDALARVEETLAEGEQIPVEEWIRKALQVI